MQARKMPTATGASETSPLLQDQENGDHEDRQVYPPNPKPLYLLTLL